MNAKLESLIEIRDRLFDCYENAERRLTDHGTASQVTAVVNGREFRVDVLAKPFNFQCRIHKDEGNQILKGKDFSEASSLVVLNLTGAQLSLKEKFEFLTGIDPRPYMMRGPEEGLPDTFNTVKFCKDELSSLPLVILTPIPMQRMVLRFGYSIQDVVMGLCLGME